MRLRQLVLVVSAFSLVSGTLGRLEAAPILLPVTVAERGIDSSPKDGVFTGPQFDPGQATVTNQQAFEERALLEFDLTPLPADVVVTSATLRLVIPSAASVGESGAVHGYAGNGVYDNADLAVTNLLATFTIIAPGLLAVDLPAPFIQALVDGNQTYAGLALRNVTAPFGVFSFWTDATPDQSLHPILAIETQVVSEPASLLLVGTGLLALARGRLWRSRVPAATRSRATRYRRR